jgi:chemotaxis protein MotA
MLTLGGLAFVFACVFGSYLASGGAIAPLAEALPFELWTIGGAALGTYVMANSLHDVKHTAAGFNKMLKGAVYQKQDYIDLLSLLYFFVRLASTKGSMALEPHIEHPEESTAFQTFPKILDNHEACNMICDYLRMVGMNADDPNQIEDVMARELRKTLNEELHSAQALQTMADGLPALGIVAAVLGVIKTMAHIDQPPAILGAMIGSALTGTFLGVLLSYGVVGPCACRMHDVVDEESKYFEVIRAVLVAHLHGNAPQVSVETGRKMAPNQHMPNFQELETAVQNLKMNDLQRSAPSITAAAA